MLAADDVDAVYIPLPTGIRKQYVIRAAEAGKHVVCEKPCACSSVDLEEMILACTENNVQFMDGVMYMHSRRLDELRQALDGDNGIGKVKRIASQFSFFSDNKFDADNIRTDSELEPFGCLGDLGWYTIRLAQWVMNYELPIRVIGRNLTSFRRDKNRDPVPMEFEGKLQYGDGTTSTFYNSFKTGHQQWAHISGTQGHVYIPDFVLPFGGDRTRFVLSKPAFQKSGCNFEMFENQEVFSVNESANSAVDSQETNMLRNFAQIVLSGNLDNHWPRIALQTQMLMDACMESSNHDGSTVEIC